MPSTTFTARVEPVKKRFERLAKSADVNEWQVAGITQAIASLDRGEGVSHKEVKNWVDSWGDTQEAQASRVSNR